MNLKKSRFDDLQEFIYGGNHLTPIIMDSQLVSLFNRIGFDDVYDFENGRLPGFRTNGLNVSRKRYVLRKFDEINDSPRMNDLLEIVFNQNHFSRDPTKNIVEAVAHVNLLIQQDGYSLAVNGDGQYRVISLAPN